MADNTLLNAGTGGDTIATDDLTTLNGGAVSGVKAQRVKVGYGVDGTFTDVAPTVGLPVAQLAQTCVSSLGTTATALTVTLPAAGAGLFHYITAIEIMRVATAAVAGSAVLGVTTTNLPGSLAWSFGNAIAIGTTQIDERIALAAPLKSSVANTATTIVAPAPGTGVQWRINVFYYTGA